MSNYLLTPSRENLQRQPSPRFVILGGSFNPVHIGHVALAEALGRMPGVAQVLAIPAAQNPLKGGRVLLPPGVRLEMVQRSLAALSNVAVLDVELRRGPPSYTLDTVFELQSLLPRATFDIALGWDAYCDFAKWHSAARILEWAGLIVVPRPGLGSGQAASAVECLPADWRDRLIESGAGEWQDLAGRSVLRLVPLRIADVSATRIWAEERWDLVPEPARALLLRHLGRDKI